MNDGRPFFTQEDPEPETSESQSDQAPQNPPTHPVVNRLRFSGSFSPTPAFEGQARLYPDTVKVIDERYLIFDVSSKTDMDRFAEIMNSSRERGRFNVVSDETLQWSEAKSTWILMIKVQERVFKTLHTRQSDPSEP